jgi:hypothetical protein
MLEFYLVEDFYKWLPVNTSDFLEYLGLTKEEYFERNMLNGVVKLDAEDVKDIMEDLMDFKFSQSQPKG